MDKPVLSTIRWRGCLEEPLRFNTGFSDLLRLDNVEWSGIGRDTFIISNNDITNPSVCLRGRRNNNHNVRMVSIATLKYLCCLPSFSCFFDFHDSYGKRGIIENPCTIWKPVRCFFIQRIRCSLECSWVASPKWESICDRDSSFVS